MTETRTKRNWLMFTGALAVTAVALSVGNELQASRHVAAHNNAAPGKVYDQQQQRAWGAFFSHEVDRNARMAPGNKAPSYPAHLKAAKMSGSARLNFVINENGRAIMRSLSVVEASDSAFAAAARSVLPDYKFIPAEIGSQPVRVWVTVPFEFTLNK